MSDEYSLHGRFLMGKDSAAEYERRLARLRAIEEENEALLASLREANEDLKAGRTISLAELRAELEGCRSGLTDPPAKRVQANQSVEGSNPSPSANDEAPGEPGASSAKGR